MAFSHFLYLSFAFHPSDIWVIASIRNHFPCDAYITFKDILY